MSQVLTSLNAVTADTAGDALSFNSLNTIYSMHYIVTVPSGGPVTVYLEGSLDGVNWFTVGSVSLGANGNDVITGGPPAMSIRARTAGLSGAQSVTALVAVVG